MWDSLEKLWRLFLNQFNLVSVLSTFPDWRPGDDGCPITTANPPWRCACG